MPIAPVVTAHRLPTPPSCCGPRAGRLPAAVVRVVDDETSVVQINRGRDTVRYIGMDIHGTVYPSRLIE